MISPLNRCNPCLNPMDKTLREVAGDNLADWVRDAIAQKLAQEQQETSAIEC